MTGRDADAAGDDERGAGAAQDGSPPPDPSDHPGGGNGRRTLIVLRHAEAAAGLGYHDAERPLTERGRDDARRAGQRLARLGAVPDLVLCSPARRTRQTWSALRAALPTGAAPHVTMDGRIYGADAWSLIDVLAQVDDAVGTVALIGHNPGVTELVLSLTDDQGAGRKGFAPASFAIMHVEEPWPDIAPGAARLDAFWTPGETERSDGRALRPGRLTEDG